MLFLITPTLGLLSPPDRASMIRVELREPNSCSFVSVVDFTQRLNGCLTDRVLYRFELIKGLNFLYHYLGTSPKPAVAVRGKNDWYYLGEFYDAAISKFRGISPGNVLPFSKEEQFKGVLDVLKGSGVNYIFSVVPDKPRIYPEYLPQWLRPSRHSSRFDQVRRRLRARHYRVLYLKDALLSRIRTGESAPLYFESDSHWNYRGAYEGYKAIMRELKKNSRETLRTIEEGELSFKPTEGTCDLANLLQLDLPCTNQVPTPTGTMRFHILKMTAGDVATSIGPFEQLEEPMYIRRISNESALNSRKLLFIDDSFGRALNPFLRQTFSEVREVHYEVLFREGSASVVRLLAEYKPDVVVVNAVERIF